MAHVSKAVKSSPADLLRIWPSSRRAGCDAVTGAEMSTHMCDVGAETVCLNGYAARVSRVLRPS